MLQGQNLEHPASSDQYPESQNIGRDFHFNVLAFVTLSLATMGQSLGVGSHERKTFARKKGDYY